MSDDLLERAIKAKVKAHVDLLDGIVRGAAQPELIRLLRTYEQAGETYASAVACDVIMGKTRR